MMTDLYQTILKTRSKSKQFCGKPKHCDASHELKNPLCGDEVTIYLQKSKNSTEVLYEAYGCSICMSSANLLAEIAVSLTIKNLAQLTKNFLNTLQNDTPFTESDKITKYKDDFDALFKVREFPSRIRCATLPWLTLIRCLEKIGIH